MFEKVTFKEKGGEGVVVVLRGTHDGSTVFITVLNRKTVGVQVHTDIFSTACVCSSTLSAQHGFFLSAVDDHNNAFPV